MANSDRKPPVNSGQFSSTGFDPGDDDYATRNRVIRQRNIVLGLVLTFFALLFFAITVVKMKHPQMPHKSAGSAAMAMPKLATAPAGGTNGH